MLPIGKAMSYELNLVLGASLFLLMIQLITSAGLLWLIWLYALGTVTMGCVDHIIVGWTDIGFNMQWRRIGSNLGTFAVSALILYGLLSVLAPDAINTKKLSSIITAIQKYMRIHNYYGTLIYIGIYFFLHGFILSLIRFWMNIGYIIYSCCYSFTKSPKETNT